MTNREDLLKGGDSGPAIDLRDYKDSILLSAVNYEDYEMPPTGQLPADQIQILSDWAKLGAPWKGKGTRPKLADSGHSVPEVNEETKKWWSYQKVTRPEVPAAITAKTKNEIDYFIQQVQVGKGLKPNPSATKEVLIRRAYYDLIGLPPSPEQVAAFKNDQSPDAWEKLIDELLASKHYGEKWGPALVGLGPFC